jgi:hypothetical protein
VSRTFEGVSEALELAFIGEAQLVRIEPAWDGGEIESELFPQWPAELPET